MHPTPDQKHTLKAWFGASRFVYNQCVERKRRVKKFDNLRVLRDSFMSPEFVRGHAWLADVPYDVRDNAIRDIDKARKAHFSKLRKLRSMGAGATLACDFKFRSARDRQQSIVIRGRDWNRSRGAYAPLFGAGVLRSTEPLPETIETDFRIVRDRLGHYYVCIPRRVAIWSESQAPKSYHGVVALDPGVRTFQTCYDADGLVTEWGAGDMHQLFQDCYAADRLQGRIAKTRNKTKKRRRRAAWHRKLQRIQNKVNEVHKKMSTWLCRNHRVVLLPSFESSRMVRRRNRKIRSKTARGMLNWAHYRFRQMLIAKSELYPWCRVVICDEAYTSKTCGSCGALHHGLGSSKTFKCPTCAYEADRDCSAARNILLRYLTLNDVQV